MKPQGEIEKGEMRRMILDLGRKSVFAMFLMMLIVFSCFYSVTLVYCRPYIMMSGVFRYELDDKWRCKLDVNFINDQYDPTEIRWLCLEIPEIYYLDGTYELLNSLLNDTSAYGTIIAAGSNKTFSYNLTEAGFDKEPERMTVHCSVSTNMDFFWESSTIVSEGTIYIKADGSIEGTTNILTVDNVTYTFIDNIFNHYIVVERDNIVVDGAGHVAQGTGSGTAVNMAERNNVTIKNLFLTEYYDAVLLVNTTDSKIENITTLNNKVGIRLLHSNGTILSQNNLSNTYYDIDRFGIRLEYSNNNTFTYNAVSENKYGIFLHFSNNNTFTSNKVIENLFGIFFHLSSSNNTIIGNIVSNNEGGVEIDYSSNNNLISRNNVSDNSVEGGITLDHSSNNILTANNVSSNSYGIFLDSSHNNTLSNNDVSNQSVAGISLIYSSNNTLFGNIAVNNTFNFWLYGESNPHFINYIDANNTVDGRPIYYLIDEADTIVDGQTNAGIVCLVNCDNMTIRDLRLARNRVGVYFFNTTNSKIENITTSENLLGISLRDSSNNILTKNNISSNHYKGIYLWDSSNNTLTDNNASSNEYYGAEFSYSSNNTMSGNTMSSNYYGISLSVSNNNNFTRNNILSNIWHGIQLHSSSNNTITNNTVSDNWKGISLQRSRNNAFSNNNFFDNTIQVEISIYSINTWDNGYPSGGNYWSDYTGVDLHHGPYQNITGGDGIGDTPYIIDADNQDNYPLIRSWPPLEHELATSIVTPTTLTLGSSLLLNATVSNHGLNNESNIELLLLINGSVVNSSLIASLPSSNSYTLSYLWTPTTEGIFNLTTYASPVPGETSIKNNQQTKFVTVTRPSEVNVGVKAGNWIKYDYNFTGLSPDAIYPEWLNATILTVEGTNVTLQVLMHMSDGAEQSDTLSVDVVAGGEASGFVIPANYTTGDLITLGGGEIAFNVTIEGETTGLYAGANRTVVYTSFSQYGTEFTYYWDKETGIMVGASTISAQVNGTATATETNMWEADLHMLGDVNGDGRVDLQDFHIASLAFGSYPNHPRWNAQADLNEDGIIEIQDFWILCKNFGKIYLE